jgi:hypothetical protein
MPRRPFQEQSMSRTNRHAIASAIGTAMLALSVDAAAQGTARDAVLTLIPGSSRAEVDAVASTVVAQIASVPLGSSSGGFTYIHDERTGEVSLKTVSFGPSFAERPITLGKAGAFTFGMNYQRTSFRTLEGVNLRNGDLRADVRIDGRPVVTLFSSTLDVSSSTTSFVAHVGLSKTIDVGVSVPFVSLSVSGSRTSLTPGSPTPDTVARDVAVSGVGDIMARIKWAPVQTTSGALAIAFETRLPTGAEDKLIGVRGVRPRILLLGSTGSGPVSPHVNLSYQFGGDGARVGPDGLSVDGIGSEIGYTAGVEVAAHPTITLSADILGRSLRRSARFAFEDRVLTADDPAPDLRALALQLGAMGRPTLHTITPTVGTLNRWLLAVGAKASILNRGLVRVDVLGALNDAGLKPGITTVLGFEYTF